jgi:tight adherence protein C
MHAGIYLPSGPSIFTSVRFVVGIVAPLVVLMGARVGLIGNNLSLYIAGVLGLGGIVGSNLWLQSRIVRRRRELRRSLPDFLDLMGACMQAGQSFEAALARVTDELRAAHQALAFELTIVQREMMLGATALRALRGFADRSGLDVIRQLATLVDQSQRFGSSMTESLRVHSEMLRMQRTQRAEAQAHKAGVKILLPTLLFIFPPVLVILAGPAVIDLHEMLVHNSAPSASR